MDERLVVIGRKLHAARSQVSRTERRKYYAIRKADRGAHSEPLLMKTAWQGSPNMVMTLSGQEAYRRLRIRNRQ